MFERDNLQPVRVFAKNVDFGGAPHRFGVPTRP
jgi:hypothetical protein